MSTVLSNQFSMDLFHHPHRLDRFLSGDMEQILHLAKNPHLVRMPTKNHLYFGRWAVMWIFVKTPFDWIFACVSSALASMTGFIGAQRLSRYFTLLGEHMSRDQEQLAHQWRYGEKLLTPSVNNPQLGAWDIYRYGNIPIQNIKNKNLLKHTFLRDFCDTIVNQLLNQRHVTAAQEEIKEAFFQLVLSGRKRAAIELLIKRYPGADTDTSVKQSFQKLFPEEAIPLLMQVEFFRPRKVCRGSTLWFIHLFMNSQKHFHNLGTCAMAVAEEFRKGVPSQGVLLQALSDIPNLLHRNAFILQENSIANDASRKEALEKLTSLPMGIYKVNVYHHAFALIKASEEEHYIFNPCFGLLRLTPEEMLDMVYTYHYKKGASGYAITFEQFSTFEEQRNAVAG